MKILLIHTEDESETVNRYKGILSKPDISIDTLLLKSVEDKDIRKFVDFFHFKNEDKDDYRMAIPSHAIIFSPLPTQWFDFFAGFSCGSHLSLLVFGQKAITGISKEFAFCFTFVYNEESLNTFFEAEYEAYKKQEAAREIIKAQNALLKMGIPVTTESLSHCAGEGHIKEVSLFLAAGFSPDTKNKVGVPLLHTAARNGNQEIVQFLIKSGAQLNLTSDDRGTSALIDAAMTKNYEMVTELVDAGVDMNIKSKDGQTALIIAVGAGYEKIVEILLKAGADPDIADSLGASARKYCTLFHMASMMKLFDIYAPEKKK